MTYEAKISKDYWQKLMFQSHDDVIVKAIILNQYSASWKSTKFA